MKLRLLLFALLLSAGITNAQQDTIRTLIISEARMDRADNSYVEITNMGTEPVQLADFEFGRVSPWDDAYSPGTSFIRLPNKVLEPGKSFVIASVLDFTEEQYPLKPDYFNERITKKEMWQLADMKIHMPEANGDHTDSITPGYQVMETWNGRDCWYLEQHINETDSVVIDQVGGVFDNPDGRNYDKAYDVAGVTNATGTAMLMRKFVYKQGNLDFANARGVDITDSEWIPVPQLFGQWEPDRAAFWTVGNHGNYELNSTSLVSSAATVDYNNNVITVPWGTRNQDDFMNVFEKKPGIAWHYDLSPAREDSAYMSAREGDEITIYAIGNTLQSKTFAIKVNAPKASDNIVVPMFGTEPDGYYSNWINGGGEGNYGVTVNAPGMDTITNSLFGITYATRVDSLFKYLEKAPKASWEIVWVDGTARPDVKNGDILKVTAENGSVKNYYIKVNGYRPNHNADLAAITWPDIPEQYRDLFGWTGDTIPNFSSTVYTYKITVPFDVDGIPALIAKPEALNSKVDVKRATSLSGGPEQRTITFTVTADDGTTVREYNVVLEKEKNPEDLQPYVAEPFVSEHVFQDQWNNGFMEICNPGNQPLDLSNYMMVFGYISSPADAVTGWSQTTDWGSRYRKYIPGYKWVDEAQWAVTPSIALQDININPVVLPGDVFVMGHINGSGTSGFPWFASLNTDIDLRNIPGDPYTQWASAAHEWMGGTFYMFKILNDSIKMGLKPANDPADFELIEVFGPGDGSNWVIGGYTPNSQTATFIRKPEFSKPKTGFKESFGTNSSDSEWIVKDRAYWNANNVGWPNDILYDAIDIGKHFMHDVTSYKSTVTSTVYKVSEGYSMNETINGMKTGLTVADFFANLIKADEGQVLTVKRGGTMLGEASAIMTNDVLEVLSADSVNTTKYHLTVTTEGLSSNAVITSTRYTVTIDQQPKSAGDTSEAGKGSVKGFDYGTALRTILANVNVPAGATMTVINGEGAYVPLKMLNYDTTYVNVTVNSNMYLEVLAEDGLTKIVYQLLPSTSEDDAFITSDIYSVSQKDLLVNYVPRGTNVATFLSNIIPNAGSSVKLVNNMGQERVDGIVADDDKVVVTSASENVSKAYYIAKLRTEYILEPAYLAYILSNVYAVDQVDFKVNNVSGTEVIASFLSKVTPAQGASAVVVDKDGNLKTTGDINGGDMVKVTSADGKVIVYYTFGPLTSANMVDAAGIEVYPNPTKDMINVSGVKAGNRIQVYSSVGSLIRNVNVQNNIERISLGNQPTGIYMIVVSENNNVVTRFKAVKQ